MPPVKSKPANEACWFQLNIHSSIETFLGTFSCSNKLDPQGDSACL